MKKILICLLVCFALVFGCASTANIKQSGNETRNFMSAQKPDQMLFKYPVPKDTPEFTKWDGMVGVAWVSKDGKVAMVVAEYAKEVQDKGSNAVDVWALVVMISSRDKVIVYTPVGLLHVLMIENKGDLSRSWRIVGDELSEIAPDSFYKYIVELQEQINKSCSV